MYTITPVKHYLAVTLHNLEGDGRILRPDSVDAPVYAKIVSVGPDCKLAQVGDCVAFQPTSVICHMEALDQYIIPEDAVVAYFTSMTLRDLTLKEVAAIQKRAKSCAANWFNTKDRTPSDSYFRGFSDALKFRLILSDHVEKKERP